jgi:hypothetical protein
MAGWTTRRSARAIGLPLLLALVTCSEADNVTVDADGEAIVPGGGVLDDLLGQLDFAGFDDVDLAQSEALQNQGYTEDDIDSVHLVSLDLEIAAPAGATFDFLERIAFFVEADGLPRVEIAQLDEVAAGSTELALVVVADVELRPYVVAEAMTVTSEVTGSRPDDDTTVAAHLAFDVDINVTGAACSTAQRARRTEPEPTTLRWTVGAPR